VEAAARRDSTSAYQSTRSTDKSAKVDIFGVGNKAHAESAHLLPHSSRCASFWFPVVPWVLCTASNSLTWDFLQQCIHGVIETKPEASNKSVESSSKLSDVGIKHFSTNRIRLTAQKTYFDDSPCVIIVPILTVKEVKNWKGGAYDAIVLAGNWDSIPAAMVYSAIGTAAGMTAKSLANQKQCEIARKSLVEMILCVCNAAYNGSGLYSSNLQTRQKIKEWEDAINMLAAKRPVTRSSGLMAPVPVSEGWNGTPKVRKISFLAHNNAARRAPDPVLLLAKAASNWLKRKKMNILPAYGNSSDDTSDDVISFSEEAKIRGWSHVFEADKKPRFKEIDISYNKIEVNESLSDNDDDSDDGDAW
jgi:hypothetical protein